MLAQNSLKLSLQVCQQLFKRRTERLFYWRLIASITFHKDSVRAEGKRLFMFCQQEGKLSPLSPCAAPHSFLSGSWTGNPPPASSFTPPSPSSTSSSSSKAAAALWITIHLLLHCPAVSLRGGDCLHRQKHWNPSKTRETLRPPTTRRLTHKHTHNAHTHVQPLQTTKSCNAH